MSEDNEEEEGIKPAVSKCGGRNDFGDADARAQRTRICARRAHVEA